MTKNENKKQNVLIIKNYMAYKLSKFKNKEKKDLQEILK